MVAYLNGGDYQVFLIKGIILFLSSSLLLVLLHYIVLKIFAEAKFKVVNEDFINNYRRLKALREERINELRKKLLAEKEAKESKENKLMNKNRKNKKAKK